MGHRPRAETTAAAGRQRQPARAWCPAAPAGPAGWRRGARQSLKYRTRCAPMKPSRIKRHPHQAGGSRWFK
eukprot:2125290-Lingulodinium_polyedra.AAC.1